MPDPIINPGGADDFEQRLAALRPVPAKWTATR